MTTRSRIGILNTDGSIDSIYCQCDGYPEYVGRILMEHYRAEEQIRQLIGLGDLDILGVEPIAFENHAEYKQSVDGCQRGCYEKCANTQTYNQPFAPMMQTKDRDAYATFGMRCGEEYLYLFEQGEWWVYRENTIGWVKVADLLK